MTAKAKSSVAGEALDVDRGIDLYRALFTCRQSEETERRIISRGEAHFYVSSAGHEAVAALAEFLSTDDWLHCHYRDRALMLARGLAVQAFFDELYANGVSTSGGRQLNTMLSDPALKIVSMPVSVANNLLPSVGIAAAIKDMDSRPVVYCSVGDGGTQQGDFYESVAEAVRSNLPVLFLVQDNRYALSTATEGKTFYSLPGGREDSFLGLPLHRLAGGDPLACREKFGELVAEIRRSRGPMLAILDVERLGSHSNADEQSRYRDAAELERITGTCDPVINLRRQLIEAGVDNALLEELEQAVTEDVKAAAVRARGEAPPERGVPAKRPLPDALLKRKEHTGAPDRGELTMREAMRDVLRARLAEDAKVYIYGEDIEDPKGDVFGVTEGLSTDYPGRVVNSALAEATIMGVTIGRALAGEKPVAFIQFADFLPLIYNLCHNELGSMFWRSQGGFECPVIVMISCGGYRPGTGPFHSQTFESVFAHTPGIDVMMPSTAGDAAGMLMAAFETKRPTLFFYPKNLLNDRSRMTSADVTAHWVQPGKARVIRSGEEVTLVGWGNTVPVCAAAAELLGEMGVAAEVIDLRSISPWDEQGVLRSVRKTGRLIAVHEDNRSCGMGAEICARIADLSPQPIVTRRVCRDDELTPFHPVHHLAALPSSRRVVDAVAEVLGLSIEWVAEDAGDGQVETIIAPGVGASDDSVTLVEWTVKPGQTVDVDACLAVIESDKAAADILSAHDGVVEEILVEEGEVVKVGTPLARLRRGATSTAGAGPAQATRFTPKLVERRAIEVVAKGAVPAEPRQPVAIPRLTAVASAMARTTVDNMHFLARHPNKSPEEIVRHTGIESRRWVDTDQTLFNLGMEAATGVLSKRGLDLSHVDLLICATTTPDIATPSLACRLAHGLMPGQECPGYDISAACSGYIYGLRAAHDFLRGRPSGRVLLVTAEVLSRLTDPDDYDTAILFGDGATATLIENCGPDDAIPGWNLRPPFISATGEDGSILAVPLAATGQFIKMQGRVVFQQAVKKMSNSLHGACELAGLQLDDISAIIPHQANDRILDALRRRLKVSPDRVLGNIRVFGNTSSCSIPYCLEENWQQFPDSTRVALVAFGGGFTYGAAVLERVD